MYSVAFDKKDDREDTEWNQEASGSNKILVFKGYKVNIEL